MWTFSFHNYRSEEHTSELQSHLNLVCRLLLEKKKIDALDAFTMWCRVALRAELRCTRGARAGAAPALLQALTLEHASAPRVGVCVFLKVRGPRNFYPFPPPPPLPL